LAKKGAIKSKKKVVVLTIIILLIIIIGLLIVFMFNNQSNKNTSKNNENSDNVNKSIDLTTIKNILTSYENNIGKIENLSFDTNYNDTYRFNQTYDGIEVYGGGIVATLKNDELLTLINYNYEIPDNFNVVPLNTENDLLNIAREHLSDDELVLNDSKLIIYPISMT